MQKMLVSQGIIGICYGEFKVYITLLQRMETRLIQEVVDDSCAFYKLRPSPTNLQFRSGETVIEYW